MTETIIEEQNDDAIITFIVEQMEILEACIWRLVSDPGSPHSAANDVKKMLRRE